MSEQPDWNAEVNEALVLFSKRLVMVQGEYNAHQKLSLTQKHAEDAQAEAVAKIKAATLDALPEKDNRLFLKDHAESYAEGWNEAIATMIERLK